MCAKILKQNGQVIYASTYRELNSEELASVTELQSRDVFDHAIRDKLGYTTNEDALLSIDPDTVTPEFDLYGDYIEGTYHHDDQVTPATVVRRIRNEEGEETGRANANPILDTRTYEVEFQDGGISEITANLIAENLHTKCDSKARTHLLMDHIVDHSFDGRNWKLCPVD